MWHALITRKRQSIWTEHLIDKGIQFILKVDKEHKERMLNEHLSSYLHTSSIATKSLDNCDN